MPLARRCPRCTQVYRGRRCPTCTAQRYGPEYRNERAELKRTAHAVNAPCAWAHCLLPTTPIDYLVSMTPASFEADHSHGAGSPLVPLHRVCNQSKGNAAG